jgi:diguanylate cyclase
VTDISTQPNDQNQVNAGTKSSHLPSFLTATEMQLLCSIAVSRAVLPNEILFKRGEPARCMYIVASGEIRLSFEEGLSDKMLGEGHYFGELAVFIGQHYRAAQAQAEGTCMLYEISDVAFQRLLAEQPAIVAKFMQRSFRYLVSGEHQLVQSLRRRNEDLLQTLDTLRQTRSELTVAQQLVRTDDLTGLANRRGLYRYLDEVGRYAMGGKRLALLLIDVDHFKNVNDHIGHLAGDSALRAVAEEVRRLAGPLDLPCRLGGDEFALVLQVSDRGELSNRALDMINAVRGLRLPSMRGNKLAITVGGAMCLDPGGWASWYSLADKALYDAKRRGGDGWRVAD